MHAVESVLTIETRPITAGIKSFRQGARLAQSHVLAAIWALLLTVVVPLTSSPLAAQVTYPVTSFEAWTDSETIFSAATPYNDQANRMILAGGVAWQSGTFTGAANASALKFTYNVDGSAVDPTGAFVVLFDTNSNGYLDSPDRGVAFNLILTGGSPGNRIFTGLQQAYQLQVSSLGSSSDVTPANIEYTASQLPTSKYQASYTDNGATVTASFAILLSDISSPWQPTLGTPTRATVFTTTQLGADPVTLESWYGTSTSFDTVNLNVPEPATWVFMGTLLTTAACALWWRRRSGTSKPAWATQEMLAR